jgi:hypothetical protein
MRKSRGDGTDQHDWEEVNNLMFLHQERVKGVEHMAGILTFWRASEGMIILSLLTCSTNDKLA